MEWLTPAQVADELQVDKRTVLRLIREGGLQASHLGHRTVRISRAALGEFMAKHEIR